MNGIYMLDRERIGTVRDFKPSEWFAHVTLDCMPEMAEFGMLDPQAEVIADDGICYKDPQRSKHA